MISGGCGGVAEARPTQSRRDEEEIEVLKRQRGTRLRLEHFETQMLLNIPVQG